MITTVKQPQQKKRIINNDNDPCAVFVHNNTNIAFEGTRKECRKYIIDNRINIYLIANKLIPNWKQNALKSIIDF